jgi:hypothetical protein
MPITVDWPNRVIFIPKDDMVLVSTDPFEVRELDLDQFRRTLKDLEDDEAGVPWPDTHQHNTSVEIAGVTYARLIEIINGYTVTFEDGQYAVNLVGANSNLSEVTNLNQVSIRSANSAGLTQTFTSRMEEDITFQGAFRIMLAALSGKREGLGGPVEVYRGVDGQTARIVFVKEDDAGNGQPALDPG